MVKSSNLGDSNDKLYLTIAAKKKGQNICERSR
jgi:hypothetical protein